ncbi:hypothetical protein [Cupriavidus alkaliphilus]|uniref:hypothetical protein n=1 Tax=Cupriavidus alkaliphilus TaxID=942866 RepID=UPI001428AB1D|nr:hypothetical protein [Cupriavidus alkaliphilus]
MRIIDIEEVKKHLERLVEEAAHGNSFIIAKAGPERTAGQAPPRLHETADGGDQAG